MSIFVLVGLLLINSCCAKPPYCLPTNTNCWPTNEEISSFQTKLNGQLVQPSDNDYPTLINMTQDLLYRNQFPEFIIVVQNVEDIQNSVTFASLHNIQISIMSTGHSYSGRSTANFSLQINLKQMRNYALNKDKNGDTVSITVETGLQWGSIFGLVTPNIIIAPDDPSVGPGGSSLRGGHSPIGPAFGLVSDFTLEYYLVDANADVIHVYNTSGVNQSIDDLFWSLKGGGGSTFGVIVNITFMTHKQNPNYKFTSLLCEFPFYQQPLKKEGYIGDVIFNNFWNAITTGKLDSNWGGYWLIELGRLVLSLQYYGDSDFAMENGKVIFNLSAPYDVGGCLNYTIYDTFQLFETQFGPDTNGNSYVNLWNDLVPKNNLTAEFTDYLCSFYNASNATYITGALAIFQGGKVNAFPDDYTAVTPAFRSNYFEVAQYVAWSVPELTNGGREVGNKFESQSRKFGIGKYSNEENYWCGDGCNWKQEFYGMEHYNRLLGVKQKWDPNQVFWCYHCIGSDQ